MISATPIIIAAGKVDAIVEKFGLAWGKFIAQVIIFWVVFTILKKYAFGPILAMLEQRRQRIADGEAKLEKISRDAAEAAKSSQAIIDKAEADAARLVKEADDAAKALQERRQQDAVGGPYDHGLELLRAPDADQHAGGEEGHIGPSWRARDLARIVFE